MEKLQNECYKSSIESFRQEVLQKYVLQDDHHGYLEDAEVT